MENEKVIVAIELGSSKISGAAARRIVNGGLEVLACASVPSSAYIKNGAVYNLDRTADGIAKLIELLERQLNTKIQQTFIGYAGKSLRTVPVVLERTLEVGAVITNELVDDMLAECGEAQSDDLLSLCVASQEFRTDHKSIAESDPVGVACSYVEGRFQRVMIRPRLFKLLDDSFKHASLDIADSYVAPMALANLILSEEERQRGCALVDYGADTVTVSVFKGGQLGYLRVIPLGSDTITKDIMSQLQLTHEQAESLKVTYGLCGDAGQIEESTTVGDKQISLKLLGEIIEARNEEIMVNVARQIRASGYYDSLFGGIVVTGGGSNLKRLNNIMSGIFAGVSPIRICGRAPIDVKWCDSSWDTSDGTSLTLLALLVRGDENCCEYQEVDMTVEPVPEEGQSFGTLSLFNDEGESAQVERDRMEAERRKAKEEHDLEVARKKAEKKEKKNSLINSARNYFHKFFDDVQ